MPRSRWRGASRSSANSRSPASSVAPGSLADWVVSSMLSLLLTHVSRSREWASPWPSVYPKRQVDEHDEGAAIRLPLAGNIRLRLGSRSRCCLAFWLARARGAWSGGGPRSAGRLCLLHVHHWIARKLVEEPQVVAQVGGGEEVVAHDLAA